MHKLKSSQAYYKANKDNIDYSLLPCKDHADSNAEKPKSFFFFFKSLLKFFKTKHTQRYQAETTRRLTKS